MNDLAPRTVGQPEASLLDNLPAVLWQYAPELDLFLYVNAGAERVTGYPRSRWLTEKGFWGSIIHPDDRAVALKVCAAAVKKLLNHVLDYRVVTASGRVIWVHDVATVRGSDPVRLNGMMMDVTVQHEAEALRHAHEASFASFLDNSPEMSMVIENDLVVYANAAAGAALGYPDDQLIGVSFPSLIDSSQRVLMADAFARMLSGQKIATNLPVKVRTKDGHTFDAEACGSTVFWSNRLAVVVVAHRDEARRKELEHQLLRADRMIALGTLTASVAHELNNPLTVILANLDFAVVYLEGDKSPALVELRSALEEATESARRAQQIIGEVSALSRESDESLVPLELGRVLAVALKLVQASLRDRAQLSSSVAPAPVVMANKGRLLQVLINLLVNAGQSIAPGSPAQNQVHASIGTDANGWARVEIADTGAGIPASLSVRVFEPFFTTKPVGEGIGLGLYISKEIVEASGGRLEALAREGGGTILRISLPPADGWVKKA